jgi:hypothetical protein
MAIHGLFDDTKRLRYIAELLQGPTHPRHGGFP